MDGDRAPLSDLIALAGRFGAEVIVDEAHATGVFGPQGRGLVAEAETEGRVFATVHTCGKALAGMGAFVSGSRTLKQFLINRARTFIFSTALPPYLAAQMRAAIDIVAGADAERERLTGLAAHLRARLRDLGFDTAQSNSQIVPVLLGTNERALQFAARMQQEGFAVRAIRPPTVPAGSARLRLSLTVRHSQEMLDRLVDALICARGEDAASAAVATRGAEPRSLAHSVAKHNDQRSVRHWYRHQRRQDGSFGSAGGRARRDLLEADPNGLVGGNRPANRDALGRAARDASAAGMLLF